MSRISNAMTEYLNKQGKYPPANVKSDYYGPITESLIRPVLINIDPQQAEDFPVDPNREQKLFDEESISTARYHSPRNPDGWVKYSGFPLRYYRSADGTGGIIISNGPDGTVQVTSDVLHSSYAKVNVFHKELIPFSYDPTNGTVSQGDIFWSGIL